MAFGTKSESLKKLKQNLKKGSGSFIKFVPKDSSLTVRFLEEPEEWVMYKEVFDPVIRKGYPLPEEGMPGHDPDLDARVRYLANAIDVDNDRVIPIQMPKTLVNQLVVRYEKYDTLLDRDYELFRQGDGLDTTYGITPEPATKMKLNKYTPLDLEDTLEAAYNDIFGDDEDEEDEDDEDEAPRRKSSSKSKKASSASASTKKRKPADDDDDDDEDDEEDDDFDDEEDDDFDEEEDDEDDEDDEEDDDEEEDEDEYWTEDELKALPVGQLRTIARDYGIKTTGLKKADLIEAIMEDDEDEEEPF